MANTFKRIAARGVGTSRVQIGAYSPANTVTSAIVIGLSVTNKLTPTTGSSTNDVRATLEVYDGTNYTQICSAILIPAGNTVGPLREIGKLVLLTGESLYLTSNTAASLDVTASILENS